MLRDRADNALSTYLSSVANRQNEVIKVLATVATIFLPLALVAGVYGMNFENMPELAWHWGYYVVVGFMGTVIIAAIWGFWVRVWINRGRRRITRIRPFAVEREKLKGHIDHMAKRYRI